MWHVAYYTEYNLLPYYVLNNIPKSNKFKKLKEWNKKFNRYIKYWPIQWKYNGYRHVSHYQREKDYTPT